MYVHVCACAMIVWIWCIQMCMWIPMCYFFLVPITNLQKPLKCSFLGANAFANLMRWLMSGLRRRTLLKNFRLSVVTRNTLHVTQVGLSATNTDIQRGKKGLKSEFMHSVRPWNRKSKTSRHQGSRSVWLGESVVTQALSAKKEAFAIGIFWTLAWYWSTCPAVSSMRKVQSQAQGSCWALWVILAKHWLWRGREVSTFTWMP